jgi:hypothetical protein
VADLKRSAKMKKMALVFVFAFLAGIAVVNFIPVSKAKADAAAQKRWSTVCARHALDPKDYIFWSDVKRAPDGFWHYSWTHRERKDETVFIGVDRSGVAEDFSNEAFHRWLTRKAKEPNQALQPTAPSGRG